MCFATSPSVFFINRNALTYRSLFLGVLEGGACSMHLPCKILVY